MKKYIKNCLLNALMLLSVFTLKAAVSYSHEDLSSLEIVTTDLVYSSRLDSLGITFEEYLYSKGYDEDVDGVVIPTLNLSEIKTLDVSNLKLIDLNGIEALSNLEVLNAQNNKLTEVDLSHNKKLKVLLLQDNLIGKIDLTFNNQLEKLNLSNNRLKSLNLINNSLLKELLVNDNIVLSELILGDKEQLVKLEASNNNLSDQIDVKKYARLQVISLCDNQIDDLVDCYINNEYTQRFDTLEEYLVYIFLDDKVDNYIEQTDEIIHTKLLDITDRGIRDMRGIELFTSLNELRAKGNRISEINLLNNTFLKKLDLESNRLENVDLSSLIWLQNLNLKNNRISNLSLENNMALKHFKVDNNELSSLSLSSNSNLFSLSANNNKLSSIYFENNTDLAELYLSYNHFKQINLKDLKSLAILFLDNNLLEDELILVSNKNLLSVNLKDNFLERINLKNGYNTRVSTEKLNILNNPNLYCVKVDDLDYSILNWGDYVEDVSVFSATESCSKERVSLSDMLGVEEFKIANNKVVVPYDVSFLEIYKPSGRMVKNDNLSGVYIIKTLDVKGRSKVVKILVGD